MLKASFACLFPEMIMGYIEHSIIKRAMQNKYLQCDFEQIRDHALGKYKKVDDTPYGGGAGQLLKINVVAPAIKAIIARDAKEHKQSNRRRRIILLDASGKKFDQSDSIRLAKYDHLVFVCGRYEGIDSRIYKYIDESISIGDYILTGGELSSLVVLDSVSRHIDGVLGNSESAQRESFEDNLLEYSQYTRPYEYDGQKVPDIYVNGHHKNIYNHQRQEQLLKTKICRPDLFDGLKLSKSDKTLLANSNLINYPWDSKNNK